MEKERNRPTLGLLSDIDNGLAHYLDDDTIQKIFKYIKKYGNLSASFLMNKFNMNQTLASQIMSILDRHLE